MSRKDRNKVEAEEEKSPNWFPKLLLLLDEHWFFHNALFPSQEEQCALEEVTTSRTSRKLLRTPSLPLPRLVQAEEQPPENYNQKTVGGRKLKYSFSSLDAPQQLISSFSSSTSSSSVCVQKQRKEKPEPLRRQLTRRRCANPHLAMEWEETYRKAIHNKKWSSFSDLEVMELQGFKDLGFVLKDNEGVSLMVSKEEEVQRRRTYLSEAWFLQRSAPPMVLRLLSRRSAEGVKQELRFWARAVACNLRKEC